MSRTGTVRAALSVCAAALIGRLARYEIAEHSMEPTLRPGDWVAGVRRPRHIRVGDIIVFDHPDRPGFELVKRVHRIVDGGVEVRSDAPGHESDSRSFGAIPTKAISARLSLIYAPRPLRAV